MFVLGIEMFERLAGEDFAYLTTTGRRTGRPHTIEIWFAVHDGHVYVLSGGGGRADWIRNLRKTPDVRLRVGTRSTAATARVLSAGTGEDTLARELLDGKYQGWRRGQAAQRLGTERCASRDRPRLAHRREVSVLA